MSSGTTKSDSRLVVTSDDHRAIIVIVVSICVIWSMLVIGARMLWRFHQKSNYGRDDVVALVGTIISIAQGGAIIGAVTHGFGKKARLLAPDDIEQAGKYVFAANILYILATCASKISMPLLIARLTRESGKLIASYVLVALSVAWGAASVLAIAFVCGLPVPWAGEAKSTCSGLFAAWVGIETVGLFMEVLILALVYALIQNLQMLLKFKIAVVGSFCLRIFLVIPVAFRLDLLHKVESSSTPFFDNTNVAVATQIILHYSLWSSSFPCMRAFLRAFDTGMGVTTGIPTHKGSNYASGTRGSSFAMQSLTRDREGSAMSLSQKRLSSASSMSGRNKARQSRNIAELIMKKPHENDRFRRASNETGSEGSSRAIITRTVEWKINYEEAPGTAI